MSSAEEYKSQGNAAFARKDFDEAIDLFSKGIALDENNHVLYSNRSASYAGIQDFENALKDATKCIQIKPDWGKGYGRQGAAYHGLGDLKAAEASYRKGLEVEPGLTMLINGLAEVQQAAREEDSSSGLNGIGALFRRDDLLDVIARSPQVAPYMAQADFMDAVKAIRQDPSSVGQYLSDNRIQALLQVLLMQKNPDMFRKAEEAELRRQKDKERQEEEERKERERAEKAAAEAEKQRKANLTAESFKDDPHGLSEWYKEKGNTFYKNKEFDHAIEQYTKAFEADQTNVAVLTNRAAVRFEQKNYDECVNDCRLAIETGRSVRADFKIIARAYERMGNAFVKAGQLQDAIKAYSDSLVENRSKEVEKKLKDVEKQAKDMAAKAYINPEIAAQHKEQGNALVKEGKYVEAKAAYDEAIRRNPADHTLYSNRALCYMKLMEWPSAKADCDKALDIEPNFVRALERRGNCYVMLKEPTKAMADFKHGLSIEPTNQGCIIGLERVQQNMFSGQRDEQAINNAMKVI
mmetsp:Transcript_50225/g.104826  ORF Transcript_50225/g.104826 Transcript_50225/m.104826 type:complete len:522 (-) Transcript_50225:496-2061(-)